jgi:hypothetical protein
MHFSWQRHLRESGVAGFHCPFVWTHYPFKGIPQDKYRSSVPRSLIVYTVSMSQDDVNPGRFSRRNFTRGGFKAPAFTVLSPGPTEVCAVHPELSAETHLILQIGHVCFQNPHPASLKRAWQGV